MRTLCYQLPNDTPNRWRLRPSTRLWPASTFIEIRHAGDSTSSTCRDNLPDSLRTQYFVDHVPGTAPQTFAFRCGDRRYDFNKHAENAGGRYRRRDGCI